VFQSPVARKKIHQFVGILHRRHKLALEKNNIGEKMVEGPGATRNADKARSLIGWKVCKIQPENLLNDFVILQSSLSVGKEVFLTFNDETAIRLHFGMNGSLLIRSLSNNLNPSYADVRPCSMAIYFQSEDKKYPEKILECRLTTVTRISAFVALSKFQRLSNQDVCSDKFNSAIVMDTILQRPNAIISDVILDQARFPGVGNVIKIEALHRSHINPQDLVRYLSEDDISRIILECRRYALEWYKRGRAPNKSVYNQTYCEACSNPIRIQKMGNDLSRTTFWCNICQPSKLNNTLPQMPIVNMPHADDNLGIPLEQTGVRLQCPQHGPKPCNLRRVRKSNNQQGRIFLCCSVRGCPYFQWADTHFPKCCTIPILRISKTAKSGGKWFLSCTYCKMFTWARPQDLSPLVDKISPLL
jgi:formamidopyrimidine-DNA glycosylase